VTELRLVVTAQDRDAAVRFYRAVAARRNCRRRVLE
jgi:hypothetical protein